LEKVMRTLIPILVTCTAVVVMGTAPTITKAEEPANKSFSVHPIGQVQKKDGRNVIVLDKKYQEGLLGLEQWSHVQ
jgi:tRNA (adenine37-N6)-methyltransferase